MARVVCLLFAGRALLVGGPNMGAEMSTAKEYQIKAGFLFNFAQFVEWPTNALPSTQTNLIIGILGDDPFGAYLDDIVRGEVLNNRSLVVRRFRSIQEVTACHVLFISRSEIGRLESILTALAGRGILTVGDFENFSRRGGMIRFVTENNKIRLRINLEAVKAAQLTMSSKLLRPAQIVAPGKD